MTGLTDYITQAKWIDILTVWFVLVDDAYQALVAQYGAWRRRGPQPDFSDSEVITVSLMIDTFFHGHEALGLAFVRQYHPDLFPHLLPDGQFNHRRRQLGLVIEQIRHYLTYAWGLIDPDDAYRLIDSAPIPVCTYARASRNQTVAGPEYFSVMACRKAKLFGLRLHLTATGDQVVDQWLLAPAAPRDSKVMAAVFEGAQDLVAFGDGAFHDPVEMARLRECRNIQVWATPRKDARHPWPDEFRQLATRLRRRIETALSVLVTVFNIEHPTSRSLSGLIARAATRLLAYNLSFIIGPLLARLTM
jgi:Transposase DDE domain